MRIERIGREPEFSRYMDLKEGWLDRRIFSDAEIYEEELYRIFARSWLFVAHESQLPKAGDFLTTHMAKTPSSSRASRMARSRFSSILALIAATRCALLMPATPAGLSAIITAGPSIPPVN